MRRTPFLATMVLLLALAGAPPAASAAPRGLKKSGPIRCDGNQDLKLDKRLIDTAGKAIVVSGNCDLTITGSRIVSGATALLVKGNGTVKISSSTIAGGRAAVVVTGRGDVHAAGSRFTGRIIKRDSGDFNDGGGNTFEKAAAAPARGAKRAPPAPELERRKPVRCTGAGEITVTNKLIKTKGTAVSAVGTCGVTLRGCKIIAGKIGVQSTGAGKIRIIDSTVIGRRAAISITGTGDVIAKGSTIKGRVKRVGTGSLVDGGGNTME